ncbi:MAG: bifunctional 23S rRNA (guanine(2069)-N(7))-methyltransferase RlmK/23S rRNA (guanine(2445)-N(2))-methyltransferase RlmL [Phycisphaerales bacterium]
MTFDFLATCAFGLESVVTRELADLGYQAKGVGVGRVAFRGDLEAIVRTNIHLRCADRVLILLATFPTGAGDPGFDALFEGVRAIPWERHIGRGCAFPVDGRSVKSALSSVPAIQRATKRAIVERLRSAWRLAPGAMLDESGPRVGIEISILKDQATLTIDTSGPGLHKRGYRRGTYGDAAIKETLAAALVMLSVWRVGRPLADPFCGSGTIAIEAALLGRNVAPGMRRSFDCELWADPDAPAGSDRRRISPAVFERLRQAARAAVVRTPIVPAIRASDINPEALDLARRNARAAGVEQDIRFAQVDALEEPPTNLIEAGEYGIVITNPPYGVRLGQEAEVEELYQRLPLVLRALPTWSFHIFTGRTDLERLFGQDAVRRRKLDNASLECCYFTFLGPRPPRDGASQAPAQSGSAPDAAESSAIASVADLSVDDVSTGESGQGAATGTATPVTREPAARGAFDTAFAAPMAAFGGVRERDRKDAADFERCLSKNLRHLRKYPSRGIHCYRVYERDVPDVPLIVDRYADAFHAVEYERPHDRTAAQQADWYDLMRGAIARAGEVPIERVILKPKHRQRGLSQHERISDERRTMTVREGDPALLFEVNLTDYVDTGLFLDHRITRQMVRSMARGRRVLNLFCYTGSFTVHAAAGACASSVSVDLSNTYLEWARRNMHLNGLAARAHEFIRGDVMEFLRSHPVIEGGSYDLVVVDPPTFSNSSMTEEDWMVDRRHVEMLELLRPLCSADAVVFFSNNFRRFKPDEAGIARAGWMMREISKQTVPPEYRNRRIHRCWRLTAAEPGRVIDGASQAGVAGGARRDDEPPDDAEFAD